MEQEAISIIPDVLTIFSGFGIEGLIIGILFIILAGLIYFILNSQLTEARKQTDLLVSLNNSSSVVNEKLSEHSTELKEIRTILDKNTVDISNINLKVNMCPRNVFPSQN